MGGGLGVWVAWGACNDTVPHMHADLYPKDKFSGNKQASLAQGFAYEASIPAPPPKHPGSMHYLPGTHLPMFPEPYLLQQASAPTTALSYTHIPHPPTWWRVRHPWHSALAGGWW